MARRSRAFALVLLVLAALAACAHVAPSPFPWEARLSGDAIVLLGEVHDTPDVHRQRLAVLGRALARGWRPAIAMEQFDRDRQSAIDAARVERPDDADHLIAAGGSDGPQRGWQWSYYRPMIALALLYDLPIVATNLSNADATRIVRGGDAAVFDARARTAIGLDRPIAPSWLAAQEHEIEEGHCHLLPPALLPAMARAQLTPDAVIASALREHAAQGIVLLAGNGHVRRDIGVPRWLPREAQPRVLAVAFVEPDADPSLVAAVDAVVRVPAATRDDPCAGVAPPR